MSVRRLAAACAVLIAGLGLSGCAAVVSVQARIEAGGGGSVFVGLRLDRQAQAALSGPDGRLDGPGLPSRVTIERLFPWVVRSGWSAPGGGPYTASRDPEGALALATEHKFASVQGLLQILDTRQPTEPLLAARGAPGSTAAPIDLPANVPLLAAARIRVSEVGERPSFDVFGRGGVGELAGRPCGARADRPDAPVDLALRSGLSFDYAIDFPSRPARSTAERLRGTRGEWGFTYGECPRISAYSAGGASTAVINGVILATLAAFLAIVLGFRMIRRKRGNDWSGVEHDGG